MVVLFGLADLLQAAFVQFGRGEMLRIVLCGRRFGVQVPHGQLGEIGLAGLLQGGIEVLRQCAAFQQFGADGIRLRQAVLRGVLQGSLAQFQAAFQRFFGVLEKKMIHMTIIQIKTKVIVTTLIIISIIMAMIVHQIIMIIVAAIMIMVLMIIQVMTAVLVIAVSITVAVAEIAGKK